MNLNPLESSMTPRSSEPVILCVDDEPEILSALRRCFRNDPYRIFTASSAEEAFARMEVGIPVDLVLSDERLPGNTGTEFLRQVRNRFPGAARALLTGFPSEALVQKGLEAGAEVFFYKPWDDRLLRDTVRRILLGRRMLQCEARPEFPGLPEGLFDVGGEECESEC